MLRVLKLVQAPPHTSTSYILVWVSQSTDPQRQSLPTLNFVIKSLNNNCCRTFIFVHNGVALLSRDDVERCKLHALARLNRVMHDLPSFATGQPRRQEALCGTGLSKSIGGRIAPSSPMVNLSPRANAATVPLTGILRSPTRTAPPTLSPFRRTSPTKSPSSQPPLSPSPRVRASVSFEESPPASPSVGRHLYASQKRYAHKRSKSLDNDPMVGIASRLPARRSLAPAASSRVSRSPGQYSPISYGGISVASAGGAFRQGGPAQYVRHQRPTGSIERPSPTTHISPAAPQRVEVEREDAVDLLTCLVQRSIAFQKTADSKDDDLYPSKSGEEEQGTSVTKGKKALRGSPRGTSISGLEEAIGAHAAPTS